MLAKVQGRFSPRLLHYSAGGEPLPSTSAQAGNKEDGAGGGGSGVSRKRASRRAPPVRTGPS